MQECIHIHTHARTHTYRMTQKSPDASFFLLLLISQDMYVFCFQFSPSIMYKQHSNTDRYKSKLYQSVCGSVNRRNESEASYNRETGGHSRSLSDGKNTVGKALLSWRILWASVPPPVRVWTQCAPLLSWTNLDIPNVAKRWTKLAAD